ncbi:MAG: hypothetical protein AAB758_01110 [Patescibacteria group bacterium]
MTGLKDLIGAVGKLINVYLLPLFMAAALLVFLWGLVKFIFKVGGSEKVVEEGRNTMIWGLLSLFVMVSVWGLINLFQTELGLPKTNINSGRGYATPGSYVTPTSYSTPSFWYTLPNKTRTDPLYTGPSI